MNRILEYIEAHLEEKLTTGQLADLAGYSEYHFLQLFKEHTGETVMEYICRRRLFRGLDAVLAGNRIIDVAVRYGFESHSAFSRAFKREFGVSPSFLRTLRLELDCIGGFVTHTLNVAMLLTEMGADADTVLAGLFSDISERSGTVDLSAELPEKVWNIVSEIGLWHTDRENCPEEVLFCFLTGCTIKKTKNPLSMV